MQNPIVFIYLKKRIEIRYFLFPCYTISIIQIGFCVTKDCRKSASNLIIRERTDCRLKFNWLDLNSEPKDRIVCHSARESRAKTTIGALSCSISHDERMSHDISPPRTAGENYADYWRIPGTRRRRRNVFLNARPLAPSPLAFALGEVRFLRHVGGIAGNDVTVSFLPVDREAAARLMISRCMANIANCGPA